MKKINLKIAAVLFLLGMAGILSMLTVKLPVENIPQEVLDKIPYDTLRLLVLVNPTIMLVLAIVAGINLYEKVNLTIPIITSIIKKTG